MNTFKIQKQTEAEKDKFLIDCFHDAGFINTLIESRHSMVSGRKGTGKTALARYLEQKNKDYGIDFALRISIRSVSSGSGLDMKDRVNSILFFVISKTVQKLLSENIFTKNAKRYWKDFLAQNDLQLLLDYETFTESTKQKKTIFEAKGLFNSGIMKMEGKTSVDDNSIFSKTTTSDNPSVLIEILKESLPKQKEFLIFLDDLDISDYIDVTDSKLAKLEIATIQELLLKLQAYNSILSDFDKKLRFVSLVREDLFEYMQGSNVNKLKSDCLNLEWNEKSFAGLLIRRLPFFEDNLEESLKDPEKAIKKEFPDSIFSKALESFETNRYATNFYAYIVAVSFNRPRDFLMFCYAMRDRLSMKHKAVFENIESAEIEYSDYFTHELRDELFLASRIIGLKGSQKKLNNLIDILDKKNGFNSSELRSELAKYLGEKTSLGRKKIEAFIEQLWWYGVIGFKEEKDLLVSFRYISKHTPFVIAKIKDYVLFLHRGLWWFSQKRNRK